VSLASDYLHQAIIAPLDSPGSWDKLLTTLMARLRFLGPVRLANAVLASTGIALLSIALPVVAGLDNPVLLAAGALNHQMLVPLLPVVFPHNPDGNHAVSLGIFDEAIIAP
jgi:hypothetical protein